MDNVRFNDILKGTIVNVIAAMLEDKTSLSAHACQALHLLKKSDSTAGDIDFTNTHLPSEVFMNGELEDLLYEYIDVIKDAIEMACEEVAENG